jgi:hypothetical protein
MSSFGTVLGMQFAAGTGAFVCAVADVRRKAARGIRSTKPWLGLGAIGLLASLGAAAMWFLASVLGPPIVP